MFSNFQAQSNSPSSAKASLPELWAQSAQLTAGAESTFVSLCFDSVSVMH